MTDRGELNRSAEWYLDREGTYQKDVGDVDRMLMPWRIDAIAPWLVGSTALELGPADGASTSYLLDHFATVDAVDGSTVFMKWLEGEFAPELAAGRLRLHHALFEEFATTTKFDSVVAMRILEHVDDPVGFLRTAAGFAAPDGVLAVMVPNAQSLHRLAAVEMGLLERPDELTEHDLRLGHRRVYDPISLTVDIEAAGLDILHRGGVFLKPLSNRQIQEAWTPEMVAAFCRLAARFPDHGAEIFAVCRRR